MGSSGAGSGRNHRPTVPDSGQPAPVWERCVRAQLQDIHRYRHWFRHIHGECGPLLRQQGQTFAFPTRAMSSTNVLRFSLCEIGFSLCVVGGVVTKHVAIIPSPHTWIKHRITKCNYKIGWSTLQQPHPSPCCIPQFLAPLHVNVATNILTLIHSITIWGLCIGYTMVHKLTISLKLNIIFLLHAKMKNYHLKYSNVLLIP